MRSFIIRPFGTKKTGSGSEINFDIVEEKLISPALEASGLEGRTTIEIISQGNIREGMFERLLTADFIIADITIHNANVFYELGIRHAMREKRTFLLRGSCASGEGANDEVPFDLKTDRYFTYDVNAPESALDQLAARIKATLAAESADSPVFQMLPAMVPQDPKDFIAVPRLFGEAVERFRKQGRIADLSLTSLEVQKFQPHWGQTGLRQVAEALFSCKAFEAAAEVWEVVRKFDTDDAVANLRLGTSYEKLGNRIRSDEALTRMNDVANLSADLRAEQLALMGSNAKSDWIDDWQEIEDLGEAQMEALESAFLEAAADYYHRAYQQDLNHFYSGFNALALFAIKRELAKVQAEAWKDQFETEEDAETALKKLEMKCAALEAAVGMSIEASLARDGEEPDKWTLATAADFALLTSRSPGFVAKKYRKALVGADRQMCDSILRQITIYTRLGLFGEVATRAESEVDGTAPPLAGVQEQSHRVLVFTGHRADAEGRETPRFPNTEPAILSAKQMIMQAVRTEKERSDAPLVGVAGGASGGDLLFHEVCDELEIPTWLLLAVPEDKYRTASVADGGGEWIRKFNQLFGNRKDKKRILVLQEEEELPLWLEGNEGYNVWQRNNLWTLLFGLGHGSAHASLIALWSGEQGDGFGGTKDMIALAKSHGIRTEILPATDLLAASGAA